MGDKVRDRVSTGDDYYFGSYNFQAVFQNEGKQKSHAHPSNFKNIYLLYVYYTDIILDKLIPSKSLKGMHPPTINISGSAPDYHPYLKSLCRLK